MKSLLLVPLVFLAAGTQASLRARSQADSNCDGVSGVASATWQQDQSFAGTTYPFEWFLSPCAKAPIPAGQKSCSGASSGYFGQWDVETQGGNCQFMMTKMTSPWAKQGMGYSAKFSTADNTKTANVNIMCDSSLAAVTPIGDVQVTSTGSGTYVYDLTVRSNHACGSGPGPSPTTPPTPPGPTSSPAPAAGHWTDLFSAPYAGVPKVTMAISCIDGSNCYVPGGTNSQGFDMFLFDGHTNGVFTPLNMPDKAIMMMAVGMGGTQESPKGVAGGFGIGNGLQYAATNTTFEPSQVPTLFVQTQDIRASASGMEVIAIDSEHVLYSKNAGMNFTEKKINSGIGQCASGRYGAMVSTDAGKFASQTWFVTLGGWPESNKQVKGTKKVSQRLSMVNGKRVVHNVASMKHKGGDGSCGYTAIIAKTTDGGNTFTNVFGSGSANTTFYWNGIDCSSVTNCVAVGEGFNQDAAAHIYHTTDGSTFHEVKKLVSSQSASYSLMSVKFKSPTEAWAAGSKQDGLGSKAVFLRSTDGGATWTDESGTLSNIGDISDVSFTKDGKHGFASAITVYDDSTILRYGNSPLPPAPPAPPTSAPQGNFIQMNCENSDCQQGCQNHTFQAGVCLPLNGGGSAMATCTPTTLEQAIYLQSSSCSGPVNHSSMPLDQCLKSTQGTYFENFCPNETPVPPSPPAPTTKAPPTPPTPAPSQNALVQMKCSNSGCSQGCTNHSFPTGQCLPVQGGASAKVTCTETTITEAMYQNSDCSGMAQTQNSPANTCEQAQGGGYLENICEVNKGHTIRNSAEEGAVLTRRQQLLSRMME